MKPVRAFDWFGTGALVANALGLALLEFARPLRRRTSPRRKRWPTNAALGSIASAVERGLVVGALVAASRFATRRRFGLQRCTWLPQPARTLAALLALDAGAYAWHRANHRIAALWRFHAVHHTDLDLDLSTAARLHPGELLLSIPVRVAQVVLAGASERQVMAYELFMQLASLSYHADVDYGPALERFARAIWMTPSLHTRHHSATRSERDCNWGVVLTIWDRLYGTYDDRPAADPRIGIEGESELERLGTRRLLELRRVRVGARSGTAAGGES